MNISIVLRRAIIGVAGLGVVFATTAFAANGNPPFATNESFSSCTSTLCIDAPPEGPTGLDGSGGWGWNTAANAPVTMLTVGKSATFTVTIMQPSRCAAGGTITLTYSSQDFNLYGTSSAGIIGTNPFPDRGGVKVFTYSEFHNTDESDSFSFTPNNPTNTALVTATVDACGQQASETFPVAIIRK